MGTALGHLAPGVCVCVSVCVLGGVALGMVALHVADAIDPVT